MSTVLNIKGIEQRVQEDFALGAAARGITQAEYLKRLVGLHSLVRLTYQPDCRWVWTDPNVEDDGVDGWANPENRRWFISEWDAEDFVHHLGEFIMKNKLAKVTA